MDTMSDGTEIKGYWLSPRPEYGLLISVTITSGEFAGKTLLLDVEEFQPYEPSAYCWTPGWNCAVEIRGKTEWFFVDECGVVWYSGLDDEGFTKHPPESVGICPQQEAEYEKISAHDAAMMQLAEKFAEQDSH